MSKKQIMYSTKLFRNLIEDHYTKIVETSKNKMVVLIDTFLLTVQNPEKNSKKTLKTRQKFILLFFTRLHF